jgi:tight adherence protein B
MGTLAILLGGLALVLILAGLYGLGLGWREGQAARASLQRLCPPPAGPGSGWDRLARWWAGTSLYRHLADDLAAAGLPWSPGAALVALLAAAAALALGLQRALDLTPLASLLWGLMGAQLGAALYLRQRRHRHLAAFHQALPEGVRLLANLLRAGRSLNQALPEAAAAAPIPMAAAFRRLSQELGLGTPLEAALARWLQRTPSPRLRFVVMVLETLHRTGGDLPGHLHHVAGVLAAQEQAAAELRGLSADTRAVALVLPALGLLLVLALTLVVPGFARVLLSPAGLLSLGVFLLLQGLIWLLVQALAAVDL